MKRFYITTAITYTSRRPHIGNVYEIVLTDAIARYKRLLGYDVFYLTGTDEHGQKIQEIAQKEGTPPKEYVDRIAGEIKNIWKMLGSSHDKFIRTTDEEHIKIVQSIFKRLYDQGDIYLGKYEGLYCVPCESFFSDAQVENGLCPDCGRAVERTSEDAYFFKMSKYQKQLWEHIEKNPEFIKPESRKKEMINNFLKPGLQDLCVSRTSFKWGIPVDFNKDHVIYVWVDALSNYISALGYDANAPGELYKKYWPADYHIIGKDILRFHTIYWPIILMALDEPLPKHVFGHPWLLTGDDKMSKSKGNVIYAEDLVAHFGADAVRYYLLHEMPYAQDGVITYKNIIARYNADLANMLGNLVNRTITMVGKYFGGQIPAPSGEAPPDGELKAMAGALSAKVEQKMDELKTSEALSEIWLLVRRCNKYIDETMPWILGKNEEDKPRLGTVLYNLIECIRIIGVLLKPFMPAAAESILEQTGAAKTDFESARAFGATVAGSYVKAPRVLFARLDEEKTLNELLKGGAVAEKKEDLPEISIEDFAKLDLRAAKIVAAEEIEGADKLLKLTLDLGGEVRTVVSGIRENYSADALPGKTVIIIANLKPVKIRGVLSKGMILAAEDGGALSLCTLDKALAPGARVR